MTITGCKKKKETFLLFYEFDVRIIEAKKRKGNEGNNKRKEMSTMNTSELL